MCRYLQTSFTDIGTSLGLFSTSLIGCHVINNKNMLTNVVTEFPLPVVQNYNKFQGLIQGGSFKIPRRRRLFPWTRHLFLQRRRIFPKRRRIFIWRSNTLQRMMYVFARKSDTFLRRSYVFLRRLRGN